MSLLLHKLRQPVHLFLPSITPGDHFI
jgi:hypothetical protein